MKDFVSKRLLVPVLHNCLTHLTFQGNNNVGNLKLTMTKFQGYNGIGKMRMTVVSFWQGHFEMSDYCWASDIMLNCMDQVQKAGKNVIITGPVT